MSNKDTDRSIMHKTLGDINRVEPEDPANAESRAHQKLLDYANSLPDPDSMNWNRDVMDCMAKLRENARTKDRMKLINAVKHILLEGTTVGKPAKDVNTVLVSCVFILSTVDDSDEIISRLIDYMKSPKPIPDEE